jgi:hypothetical protein
MKEIQMLNLGKNLVMLSPKVAGACNELFDEIWNLKPALRGKPSLTMITSLVIFIDHCKVNPETWDFSQDELRQSVEDRASTPDNLTEEIDQAKSIREDEFEISLSVEPFGSLSALCVDLNEVLEIEPNQISKFLDNCGKVQRATLAQGYSQNAWIGKDVWQLWASEPFAGIRRSDATPSLIKARQSVLELRELNAQIAHMHNKSPQGLHQFREDLLRSESDLTDEG